MKAINDNNYLEYAGFNAEGSYTVYDHRPGVFPILAFDTREDAFDFIAGELCISKN